MRSVQHPQRRSNDSAARRSRARQVLALASLVMLAACGGGGSSPPRGLATPGLAGPTVAATSLATAQLHADPAGRTMTSYAWRQVGGPTVPLVGSSTPCPSMLLPRGPATLTFEVTARTSDGDLLSDQVSVTVAGEVGSVFQHRSSFAVTGGGEAHAEVVAHHPGTQRIFIVNAADGRIDIYSISNVAAPLFIGVLNATIGDVTPNSVAVSGNLLAVAFENDNKQTAGTIHFFHCSTLAYLGQVPTGALPDMVGFSPDGTWVATANEGEPNDIYTIDPLGTVTIAKLDRSDPDALNVMSSTTVDFTSFNPQIASLRASGVRIYGPGATVAQDLEPEYLAFHADSTKAYVVCQEANAIAVLDLASATFEAIRPLGLKRWDGIAHPHTGTLQQYPLPDLPVLGTTAAGQAIRLGGFSGLHLRSVGPDGIWHLTTVPDRGPVTDTVDVDADPEAERPFALPALGARLVHLAVNPATGVVAVEGELLLKRQDGTTPITGLPNTLASAPGMAGHDEDPVDLLGQPLALDPLGGDLEGLVQLPDGTWWVCDEYRPSLYRFDATGTLIARYVPTGAGAALGTETLPAALASRRANRGFEGIAYDPTVQRIYAWVQSPLDNPDTANDATSKASRLVRIVEVDPSTGATTGEFVQTIDCTLAMDKIGDAVHAGEPGTFFVIERDSALGPDAAKKVVVIRLAGATNLQTELDAPTYAAIAGPGGSLETTPAADLGTLGITPVAKTTYVDLVALGYHAVDKPEGLARLPDGRLLVINDNDFGMGASATDTATGLLTPAPATASGTVLGVIQTIAVGFDGGDQDGPGGEGGIRIQPWPVHGMYQPDGIAGFACGDDWLLVTANEGDSRDYDGFTEEYRLRDSEVALDPGVFPNAGSLTNSAELGRLRVTNVEELNPGTLADGDIDGDGDQDRIQTYGARSFSIWDTRGRLVYDSGDLLERLTSRMDPDRFNQNGPDSFDERSDDKGPEPEGVVIAMLGGVPHAVIGLERYGGCMVFNVGEPTLPRYVGFLDNPFDVNPEGLAFVTAADSPTGNPLILGAYEVSGTVAIFELLP